MSRLAASIAIGLCAAALCGCTAGSRPAGILDDVAAPALHGLPLPPSFRVVGKREWPHGFDNEPVLPEGASIILTLRTRVPIAALPVLAAVQRQLVQHWRCFPAPLGMAGYADRVDCEHDGVAVEYRAADWDKRNWARCKVRELIVTVSGPRSPDD